MLYIFPIEPLEERYSADWLKWTEKWAKEKHIDHFIVHSQEKAYGKITKGQFLDCTGTNIYKAEQLRTIMRIFDDGYVRDGDIFWTHDLWFPGIEMLAYVRDAVGVKIKIYGMLHAGTYDPHDFITQCGMEKWGRHLERAWLEMVDGVFVATHFHKKLIHSAFGYKCLQNKLHVVPFPLYWEQPENTIPWHERENLIVFPHRMAPEKGTNFWNRFKWLGDGTSWQCVATKEVCKTKQEYYDLLKRAKYAISFASQETWGIAMQEAVLCGCMPIVPCRLSYAEMYPNECFYVHNELNVDIEDKAWDAIFRFENANAELNEKLIKKLADTFAKRGESAFDCMYYIMTGE